MSIYSNDKISKIVKLTTRELPHLTKTAKITVREIMAYTVTLFHCSVIMHSFQKNSFRFCHISAAMYILKPS